jgi:hypothetical protein
MGSRQFRQLSIFYAVTRSVSALFGALNFFACLRFNGESYCLHFSAIQKFCLSVFQAVR